MSPEERKEFYRKAEELVDQSVVDQINMLNNLNKTISPNTEVGIKFIQSNVQLLLQLYKLI